MKRTLLVAAFFGLLPVLLVSAVVVQNAVALKENKQNVVASRLEGVWVLDEQTTHWLGASKDVHGIVFVRDEKVAKAIPAKHADALAMDVYLAGTVQMDALTMPFVLTSQDGNPRVITFREVAGDRYAVLDGFNVMLCPALERSKDQLFVGGAKNDRPFAVFVRKNLAPDKGN